MCRRGEPSLSRRRCGRGERTSGTVVFMASKYLSNESVREPNVDCACLPIIALVDGGSGTASNVPARGRSRGLTRGLASRVSRCAARVVVFALPPRLAWPRPQARRYIRRACCALRDACSGTGPQCHMPHIARRAPGCVSPVVSALGCASEATAVCHGAKHLASTSNGTKCK